MPILKPEYLLFFVQFLATGRTEAGNLHSGDCRTVQNCLAATQPTGHDFR